MDPKWPTISISFIHYSKLAKILFCCCRCYVLPTHVNKGSVVKSTQRSLNIKLPKLQVEPGKQPKNVSILFQTTRSHRTHSQLNFFLAGHKCQCHIFSWMALLYKYSSVIKARCQSIDLSFTFTHNRWKERIFFDHKSMFDVWW